MTDRERELWDRLVAYYRRPGAAPGLGSAVDSGTFVAVADELDRLRRERDALLSVLEPILVEIEPFRYAQRQEIERQVAEKQEWAKHHNARCGNSNEMWFYSTEFRRSLEANMEPLTRAIGAANEVYDRIAAGLDAPPLGSEVTP